MDSTISGQMAKDETSLFDGVDTSLAAVAQFAGPKPPEALTAGIEGTLRRQFESSAADRERVLSEQYKNRLAAACMEAAEQAKEVSGAEVAALRELVQQRDRQITETRQKELDLLQRERSLADKAAEVDLEIARRLETERAGIREEVARRLDEERQTKDLEKDKQLSDLRTQLEVLKRKLEQGSQQTQGEAVELQLEELLTGAFPFLAGFDRELCA